MMDSILKVLKNVRIKVDNYHQEIKLDRGTVAQLNFNKKFSIRGMHPARRSENVILETKIFRTENDHQWALSGLFPPEETASESYVTITFSISWGTIELPFQDSVNIRIFFSIEDTRGRITNVMEASERGICGGKKLWVVENFIKRNKLYDSDAEILHKLPDGDYALNLILSSRCTRTTSKMPSGISDFRIKTSDGEDFFVHKAILKEKSVKLAQIFSRVSQGSLVITDKTTKKEVIREMLRFIYTGNIFYKDDQLQNLIAAATLYEVVDLTEFLCFSLIGKSLSVETAVHFLLIAENLKCEKWKEQVLLFIIYHAKEIVKSKGCSEILKKHPTLIFEIFEKMALQS